MSSVPFFICSAMSASFVGLRTSTGLPSTSGNSPLEGIKIDEHVMHAQCSSTTEVGMLFRILVLCGHSVNTVTMANLMLSLFSAYVYVLALV